MNKHKSLLLAVLYQCAIVVTPGPASIVLSRADNDAGASGKIDTRLRITAPLTGGKIVGKAWIRGNAKPESFVNISISSTYYKLGIDQRKRKIFKGEGPVKGILKKLKVKTDGQGFWETNVINFRNQGWTETFKIVATSVEGKNSTYVMVTNDTKPSIAWD